MDYSSETETPNFSFVVKHIILSALAVLAFVACNESKEHTAPSINDKDSVATMTSYGVSTLISDSGVMKYRIITERWEVNEVTVPPRWTFIKGVFFQQYDKDFHVAATITADTAWFYNTLQLWELRGRVEMRNVNGTLFNSEELFWDQRNHELYSHKYSRLFTPERQIEGTEFRSDEYMTRYYVDNSKGAFPTGDLMEEEPAPPPSPDAANDSAVVIPDAKPHSAPVPRPRQQIDAASVNRAKQSINELRRNMN